VSYLELNLLTRSDWEKYYPRVSRAQAIRGVTRAICLFGIVMLLDLFLINLFVEYSRDYQGQRPLGTLWYVLFPPIISVVFSVIALVKNANAFRHAPPATREDRDSAASVLSATARTTFKLAMAFGILLPALVILLPEFLPFVAYRGVNR
jgi:hypothetical protein